MVRGTVEEALNAMLDAEADRLCDAGKDERTESRKNTWAASYEWSLETKARSVKLKMPKLRRQSFEVAIIERYQRRESSVEDGSDRDGEPSGRHAFKTDGKRRAYPCAGSRI